MRTLTSDHIPGTAAGAGPPAVLARVALPVDTRTAQGQLLQTLALHARVLARWPALRDSDRAALPELVVTVTWERILAAAPQRH